MDLIDIVPASLWRPVLVIETPSYKPEQLAALRDHVVQSLKTGVLVLPDDCSWGLEAMPEELIVRTEGGECRLPTGGDMDCDCMPEPAPEPEPTAEPEPPPVPEEPAPAEEWEGTPPKGPMDVSLHGGRNADEKREIQLRMIAYRREHGLGCWQAVAKASRGKLTEDQLREMFLGNALLPVVEWRLADKALDKAEGQK